MGTVEHDTARHYAEQAAQDREADAFAAWLNSDRYNEAVSALWASEKLTLADLFALTVEAVCVGDLSDATVLAEVRDEVASPRNLIAAQLLEDWHGHLLVNAQNDGEDRAEDMALQRAGGYL